MKGRTRSWQILGGPRSLLYSIFDLQRRWLNRRLVRYLASVALRDGDNRVLEAGSGPGFASWLFAQCSQVRLSVAVDLDVEAIREGRKLNPGRSVIVADLYKLPFRSQSFDLVWNSSTLEHLAFPDAALEEMRRVVRDEGYVFVGTPYLLGPLGFQPLIKNTPLGVWIGPVFGRATLLQMLRHHGFTPVSTRTYFFRFFVGVVGRKVGSSGMA
jgi:SAM-dependent methyltransferase